MESTQPSSTPQPASVAPAKAVAQPSLPIDSSQLLAGRKQVAIMHGGELYSLRVTRNGKLILTK